MSYDRNKKQNGLNISASQDSLDPIHAAAAKNPGKLPFVPVNNSYKKVYPGLHEEINHENFGAIKPIKGGLGTRSRNQLPYGYPTELSPRNEQKSREAARSYKYSPR